jgi:hypothetical protein
MTITQTIDVPADRRITLDVPREVPTGPVVLIFKPIAEADIEAGEQASTDEALASAHSILEKHIGAFEALAK